MTRRLVTTAAGWRAIAVCGAAAGAVSAAVFFGPPPALSIAPGAVAAVLAVARRGGAAPLVGFAALVAAAVAVGIARGAPSAPAGGGLLGTAHGSALLTGTVREGTGSRRVANQVVVDVDRVVHGDGEAEVHAGVLASLRNAPLVVPGDRVQLDVTGLRAPQLSGPEAALGREGIEAVAQSPTLTVVSEGGVTPRRGLAIARGSLASSVDAALAEPASSMVNGITFAVSRPLPADLTAALRDSGLAHVLAVSGLKVVLVAGLVGGLCSALALSPRSRLMLTVATVGGYVLLTGASAAAVRSALMAGAGWGLHGTGRSPDSLPLLATVAAAMLLVSPALCRDVGFQLSFLGTLGILLLAAPIAAHLPGPQLLREPFAVTIAAQLATFPISASAFGVVSLVGPVANALVIPLLPPLIVCGALGAGLATLAPALGFLPLQVAGALAGVIGTVATWSAGLPVAAVHVPAWPPALVAGELCALGAAAAAWIVLRRHMRQRSVWNDLAPLGATAPAPAPRPTAVGGRMSRRTTVVLAGTAALLAGSVAVLAASRPDGRLHVAVLDVGAARAVAIQTPAGDHALVDAGADPQHLLPALGAALPPLTRSLGLLVMTGGDRSAVGGVNGLADRYSIDRAIAPSGLPNAARSALTTLAGHGTAVTQVAPGTTWSWGGTTWRLLSASTPGAGCAVEITDAEGTALILGNLAVDVQDELAALQGTALHADLLVAPPSGSVTPALLDAVRPRSIAVPSDGGAPPSRSTLRSAPRPLRPRRLPPRTARGRRRHHVRVRRGRRHAHRRRQVALLPAPRRSQRRHDAGHLATHRVDEGPDRLAACTWHPGGRAALEHGLRRAAGRRSRVP